MRVEYINPFVETSYRILKEVLDGSEVKRGALYLKSTAMPVMGGTCRRCRGACIVRYDA